MCSRDRDWGRARGRRPIEKIDGSVTRAGRIVLLGTGRHHRPPKSADMPDGMRAPSVIGLRAWSPTAPCESTTYTFGGSSRSAFQSVDERAVRDA